MIVTAAASLSPADLVQINEVISAATAADDRAPVSEEALLHLRFPDLDRHVQHVLAREGGRIVGYAALLPTQGPRPMVAEIAVAPPWRGRGVGHEIVNRLLALGGTRGLALWAHGRNAPAAQLAQSMGFDRQRGLLHMRRSLARALPRVDLPAGFELSTFRPGIDDAAFLTANAAAFTALPDQGGWGTADLSARIAEPWFDADGFFLVRAGGSAALAGFHWTKLHPPQPLGEIYVLAVVPPFPGRGLAAPLALHGLRYLRARGATTAILYVDDANAAAVRLYERLGFTVWDVDVLYARTGD